MEVDTVKAMKVADLKIELEKKNLAKSGTKAVLVERLLKSMEGVPESVTVTADDELDEWEEREGDEEGADNEESKTVEQRDPAPTEEEEEDYGLELDESLPDMDDTPLFDDLEETSSSNPAQTSTPVQDSVGAASENSETKKLAGNENGDQAGEENTQEAAATEDPIVPIPVQDNQNFDVPDPANDSTKSDSAGTAKKEGSGKEPLKPSDSLLETEGDELDFGDGDEHKEDMVSFQIEESEIAIVEKKEDAKVDKKQAKEEPSKKETPSKSTQDKDDEGHPDILKMVWVSNLTKQTRALDLKTCFGQYGKVMSAKVVMNPNAKEAKCFGLVTMADESMATKAIQTLNGYKLHNKEIATSRPKKDNAVLRKMRQQLVQQPKASSRPAGIRPRHSTPAEDKNKPARVDRSERSGDRDRRVVSGSGTISVNIKSDDKVRRSPPGRRASPGPGRRASPGRRSSPGRRRRSRSKSPAKRAGASSPAKRAGASSRSSPSRRTDRRSSPVRRRRSRSPRRRSKSPVTKRRSRSPRRRSRSPRRKSPGRPERVVHRSPAKAAAPRRSSPTRRSSPARRPVAEASRRPVEPARRSSPRRSPGHRRRSPARRSRSPARHAEPKRRSSRSPKRMRAHSPSRDRRRSPDRKVTAGRNQDLELKMLREQTAKQEAAIKALMQGNVQNLGGMLGESLTEKLAADLKAALVKQLQTTVKSMSTKTTSKAAMMEAQNAANAAKLKENLEKMKSNGGMLLGAGMMGTPPRPPAPQELVNPMMHKFAPTSTLPSFNPLMAPKPVPIPETVPTYSTNRGSSRDSYPPPSRSHDERRSHGSSSHSSSHHSSHPSSSHPSHPSSSHPSHPSSNHPSHPSSSHPSHSSSRDAYASGSSYSSSSRSSRSDTYSSARNDSRSSAPAPQQNSQINDLLKSLQGVKEMVNKPSTYGNVQQQQQPNTYQKVQQQVQNYKGTSPMMQNPPLQFNPPAQQFGNLPPPPLNFPPGNSQQMQWGPPPPFQAGAPPFLNNPNNQFRR